MEEYLHVVYLPPSVVRMTDGGSNGRVFARGISAIRNMQKIRIVEREATRRIDEPKQDQRRFTRTAVIINGKLADSCTRRGPDEVTRTKPPSLSFTCPKPKCGLHS